IRAAFLDSRLTELAARVAAGPGTVDRRLVQSVSKHLNLEPLPRTAPLGSSVPYTKMALGFGLNGQGLQIAGYCQETQPPSVLMDRDGPLLGPQNPWCPVAALLAVPGENPTLLTRQASRLAVRLPLCDSVQAEKPSPPDSTRTRLSSDIRVRPVR
ncbi:MAG: hypothetical protein JW818_09315, partial [Pirellulales bacterium]|nr:hypothetical protein [Pirellulales bacterium]